MARPPPLAKLTRPRLEAVVARHRLLRRLDEAGRRGVTWIEGPPGSGKTTLVASYLERRRSRAIWYRLDEADGDPATLLHYLAIAARGLARRRAALPRFRPGAAVDVATFARHFFRALYGAIDGSFVLVLDDHHALPADSPSHTVIGAALSEKPPAARILVMSRAGAPDSLARLRVSGELERIGPEELRLTGEETRTVVRLQRKRASAAACEAYHAKSDGWAAGLTLLLAAASDDQGPAAQVAGSREIFQYLAGEVLDRSTPETRRLLLETAFLAEIHASTARELTGIGSADAVLAELARRGYFTIRHGGRAVYTYHPLFRDFLVDRARRELPRDRLVEVRLAAAGQAERTGAIVDAFALLRDAGHVERAARLVCDQAEVLIDEGRSETLRRLIADLPAPAREDPWVSYWYGASFHGVDLEGARAALSRSYGTFLERGDVAGAYRACAAILDSYSLEWVEFRSLEPWIAAFEELRRRWPTFPSAEIEALASCGIFTALSAIRPDDPSLPEWQARVDAIAAGPSETTLRERARFALAQFAIWRGDLRAARAVLDASTRSARRRGRDPAFDIGWMIQAARASATAGDGDASLALVEEALALGVTTGSQWWDVGARLVGVWGATVVQDEPRAHAYLARLEYDFDASMQTYIAQVRALCRLRTGDRDGARKDLLQALALDRQRGALYAESWDHAALAAIAAVDGDAEALRLHLQEADRQAGSTRSIVVRYWTLLVRASAALDRDRPAAVRLACEALRLSREEGPFDEMWVDREILARACALALEEGDEPEEARAVITRRRLGLPAGVSCDAWPHPLAIRTLGGLSIEHAGARALVPSATRPVQLLKALVALGGRDVEEWKLTDGLWPDNDPGAAQHALEMNLSRLRKLLGTRDAVSQTERRLSLESSCWVDADALEALLVRAGPSIRPDDAESLAGRALALYRGPFLAGDESAWARARRERIRRRLRAFRDGVTAAMVRAGSAERAQAFARELAERDPDLSSGLPSSRAG